MDLLIEDSDVYLNMSINCLRQQTFLVKRCTGGACRCSIQPFLSSCQIVGLTDLIKIFTFGRVTHSFLCCTVSYIQLRACVKSCVVMFAQIALLLLLSLMIFSTASRSK